MSIENRRMAAKFVDYHLTNPEIWNKYEATILSLIKAGKLKGGVKAVTETIRWNTHQPLINTYDSFYSRLFAHAHPSLAWFFDYKKSAADCIDYGALLEGDAKGALDWEDPQLDLPLETA
jgi:hypothetical protein